LGVAFANMTQSDFDGLSSQPYPSHLQNISEQSSQAWSVETNANPGALTFFSNLSQL
jgi:hypothetical protein